MQPGVPATFVGGKGQGSRIDYVLTRLKQTDHEARQCAPIPSCPLVGLTPQGHCPLGVLGLLDLETVDRFSPQYDQL